MARTEAELGVRCCNQEIDGRVHTNVWIQTAVPQAGKQKSHSGVPSEPLHWLQLSSLLLSPLLPPAEAQHTHAHTHNT